MQIKELCRTENPSGETVVEYEAGKLLVRLIDTYDRAKTFEEMLYVIACRRLAAKLA